MKSISSTTFAIIFSLIIMVVLIAVGIGFIYGKTDIPFEELWELGPESGVPTETGYEKKSSNPYGTADLEEVDRPFSDPSGPHDLSEVACAIANDIFNDFSDWGKIYPRTGDVYEGLPSWDVSEQFVSVGSFWYEAQPSDITQEGAISAAYPGCHICEEGGVGITHLDEVCINRNLQDRLAGGFCDGYFQLPTSENERFGNFNCGEKRNGDNWQLHCDGYCDILGCHNTDSNGNDFCDNYEDRMRFSVDDNSANPKWKVKDTVYGINSKKLEDDARYMYGVFWVPEAKHYDVVFSRIPHEDAYITNNFDDIAPLFNKNTLIYRRNTLGQKYTELRVVAVFTVDLPVGTTVHLYNDIMTDIQTESGLSILNNEIVCKSNCKDDGCIGDKIKVEAKCEVGTNSKSYFYHEPIKIYTNATDIGGLPLTDCNAELIDGREYKVIVNHWWGHYITCGWPGCDWSIEKHCYKYFDRTVSILEIG